jgi:hypothetical protein
MLASAAKVVAQDGRIAALRAENALSLHKLNAMTLLAREQSYELAAAAATRRTMVWVIGALAVVNVLQAAVGVLL